MRSYVDPIINAAVFSQIDLHRDLRALLTLKYPERFLPSFLHEGTHHACFLTPVGTALALLRLRAFRRATELRKTPEAGHFDLLEDVLRQEATMELLRPLSEGLACFSELDSIPGNSNVITTPMRSTFFNFGGNDHEFKTEEIVREKGIGFFLFSLLYRGRLDPDFTQRRENVLAGRFGAKGGGYLSGYMAVKKLWAEAREKFDRPYDAELFSMYLRSYFYDDYGLVAQLLDDGVCEHRAVVAIADYIQDRFSLLTSLDWDTYLTEFEKHFERTLPSTQQCGPLIVHPFPGGLANDPNLHQAGIAGLERLVLELVDSEHADLVQRMMSGFDAHRLRKRELLCLGSVEAEVEVNAYGRVSARSEKSGLPEDVPFFNAPAEAGVAAGKDAGSVEFYLIPSSQARASAIIRRNEVVHVQIEGPLSKPRKEQLASLFGTRSKDIKIMAEQNANLELVLARSPAGIVRNNAKGALQNVIDRLYLWLITRRIPEDRRATTAAKLSSGGFYELCGKDREFVHGFAFLGVATSVNQEKAELAKVAKERGIDLEGILNKARAVERDSGITLFLETEEKLFILI